MGASVLILSQASNQSTDPHTQFQVSSVLSNLPLPPFAFSVIRKLFSTIKNNIRFLSDLEACTGGTKVQLSSQYSISILS